MIVRFKDNPRRSTRRISTEGFFGDLFGMLFGGKEEGQVKVQYDAEFESKVVDIFNKTYLDAAWLADKQEASEPIVINVKALFVNGRYPTDVAAAVERFVKDTTAFTKRYLPILKQYHLDMAKLLKDTLKLKTPSEMLKYAEPKILELRAKLIKEAPTFPLLGMQVVDVQSKKDAVVEVKGVDKRKVSPLTKTEIQRISRAIVSFVEHAGTVAAIEEQFILQDYEDLIENEFSDLVDDYEDEVYDLAGMFDSTAGRFAGDYITDINVNVPRVFRTLDVLMSKSLK